MRYSLAMEHRELTIHDHRLSYYTAGNGPVLLLIHGMAGSATTWRQVIPGLSERFSVVAPDLPGHGRSDKPPGDYSLGAFASSLRDLLVALGHEHATVVGQSLGGGIAMQFSYQYPERCERLVLVGSGGLGREVNPLLRLLTLPGSDTVLRLACATPVRDALEFLGELTARIGLRPTPVSAELWRSYASLSERDTRAAFLRTLRAVIDARGQAVSAANRLHLAAALPTLILWGDADRIIPVEHAYGAHASIEGSQLVIFEGVGHYVHCEAPERFVAALTEFVESTVSARITVTPDQVLRSWQEHGNIVLLQSELLLWKNWNLDFVPRLGEEEFGRVRNTIHDLGMRFIVYTSPYYFLKGTALEPRAINTFEGFTGWPPGTPTGENMGLFLPAIRRVMRDYKPDGLYFDGQYTGNPAALYALARSAREIVGEDGILEWHSTGALGSAHCYLPQADAYVDFILRGEGRQQNYADFDYLRFFVSGYNINNCIGVICNNGPVGVTPELARDVLRANARFHTIASWLDKPEIMGALNSEYQPRLTPDLEQTVEEQVNARQKQVVEKFNAMQAEYEALRNPPSWSEPTFTLRFHKLPDAEQIVSKQNPNPFSIGEGSLHIQAHAHTYAYFRIPWNVDTRGLIVKLRQGSDGGMSWGPAAMLVWGNGARVRLGTRSDGTLQSDVLGAQHHGSLHDPNQWIWLRARWLGSSGVVERSIDGTTYERIWNFEHGGALDDTVTELLVGKVPYNGEPKDYNVPGHPGECDIAFVEVFGS